MRIVAGTPDRIRQKLSKDQLTILLQVMRGDSLSSPEHTGQLASDLSLYHSDASLLQCATIGELLVRHQDALLGRWRTTNV